MVSKLCQHSQSIFSPKHQCRGNKKIVQSIRKRKQMLNACASLAFVVTFKFQVFQVFIYLQHTLKLLLGWLANSKELIVASQTVHTVEWTLHTTITITLGREENSKIRIWKEELDLCNLLQLEFLSAY